MKRSCGMLVAVLLLAAGASSAMADSGPVGQWNFSEGSGTVATDSSGNGDNGTILGGAQWVPGRNGGSALAFNGTTSVVQVPSNPVLEPASAITVAAWVESAGSPGHYRYIVAKGESGCHSASYGLYTGSSGGLSFYVYDGHDDSYTISPDAGTGVWDGSWHFVVGTYDGSTVHLYVDGNEVGSGTPRSGPIPYGLPDSDDLFIGGYPAGKNYDGCAAGSFLGDIGGVTIWNTALSSARIRSMTPQAPTQAPTGGQTPTAPAPTQVSSPGGHQSAPPEIAAFRVSNSGSARGATTITYSLTQAAQLSFSIVVTQPGAMHGGRCVKASKAGKGKQDHCTRLVTLARFTQAGKAGVNRLHFTARLSRELKPYLRYRLEATPTADGRTGKTVMTTVTVRR